MASITNDQLKRIISDYEKSNGVFRNIIEVANIAKVSMKNAAQLATYIGEVFLDKGKSDTELLTIISDSFFSALYAETVNTTRESFSDMTIHRKLLEKYEECVNFYKQHKASTASSGLFDRAASGGGSLFDRSGTVADNSGMAISKDMGVFNSTPEPSRSLLDTLQPSNSASPFTRVALDETAKPTPTQIVVVKEKDMEKYNAHEIIIDYSDNRVPASVVNKNIKLFNDSQTDMIKPLRDMFENGDEFCELPDLQVVVKSWYDVATSASLPTTCTEVTMDMLSKHLSIRDELRKSIDIEDISELCHSVVTGCEKLREILLGYTDIVKNIDDLSSVIKMETNILASNYLNEFDKLLTEAIKIGTKGCLLPNGKRFKIDNPMGALRQFGGDTLNAYLDDLGICSYDSYFRELFLIVSRFMTKLRIISTDTKTIEVGYRRVQIMTAVDFRSYVNECAVSNSSFGQMSNLFIDLYNLIEYHDVDALVTLFVPRGESEETGSNKIELISTGEIGAMIRYYAK